MQSRNMIPLEVAVAVFSDSVMYASHDEDELLFLVGRALDVKLGEEVIRHSHQGVLRPTLKPVHRAARDQAWELECATSKLLANLYVTGY